jgi:hypothetical protein
MATQKSLKCCALHQESKRTWYVLLAADALQNRFHNNTTVAGPVCGLQVGRSIGGAGAGGGRRFGPQQGA